ncbi:hypothetical protein [Lysinibacillus fusiformis]|uniref:hypothetical protein n=1 Tax=Lysinibacillus fusiformis TaxID=28031 RepID=UPI003D0842C6
MNTMTEEKKYRLNFIDKAFSEHGDEILECLEDYGVLVEDQFGLHSMVFKNEQDYLETKLLQLGLPIIQEDDEDENINDYLILGGYHNGSDETGGNHFYYIYYVGHDNASTISTAKETAINVYLKSLK